MAAGGSIGGPGAPSGGELAPRIDAAPSTPTPPKPTQRPTRQSEATRIIEARRKKAAEAAIPQSTDLPAQAAEAAATAEAAKGKSPTSVLEGFASGSLPPLPDLIDMADRKMEETGEQYSRERITDEIVRELAENPK